MSIELLARLPSGLCVLTQSGELGVLESGGEVRVHAALTKSLNGHLDAFLRGYRSDPDAGDRRVAVLHHSSGTHPWHTATLSLEDQVVRDLYPAGGRARGSLTSFQQRQRHRSLYRGLELMIEYRHEVRPDTPMYCPVLYAVPARLECRVGALGRAPTADESANLVLDVLNLAALGDHRVLDNPAISALNRFLIQRLIDKSRRAGSLYEVVNKDYEGGPEAPVAEPQLDHVPDWKLLDEVTLPQVDLYRPHEAERVDHIECWLRHPRTPVKPERLREFVQFQDMDEPRLNELAARSPLYSAPGGTHLLDSGVRDAWNLYLLDGALMLTASDGATLRIDGGSRKARFPVSFLKPRKYKVDALSPVNFLWIHDMLLAAVNAPEAREPE